MTTLPSIHLPLRITATDESYVIRDAAEVLIAAVYFDEGDEVRRLVRKRITRAEALAAVKAAARAVTAMAEGQSGV